MEKEIAAVQLKMSACANPFDYILEVAELSSPVFHVSAAYENLLYC